MARFNLRYAADVVLELAVGGPGRLRAAGRALDRSATTRSPSGRRAADAMCDACTTRSSASTRRTTPSSTARSWDLAGTPAGQVPAAAALPPAGDLPPPGAQAGRRGAGACSCTATSSPPSRNAATSSTTTRSPPATRPCRRACSRSSPPRSATHDLALHYFRESLYVDLADTHGNTVDGAHVANVGGVWACLVHGFAGVRDSGTHLRIAPRLPAGWQAMRFNLHRHGGDIAVAVDPTGATVTVKSGDPVPTLANGVTTEVAQGHSLRVAGRAS